MASLSSNAYASLNKILDFLEDRDDDNGNSDTAEQMM